MKRALVLIGGSLVGLTVVGLAVAGLNRNYSVHAVGALEVPLRDTPAQGQAIFNVSKDGDSVDYRLIASNIENVTQAHIHLGPSTSTGPIVVWLYPNPQATQALPGGAGRHDGVLAAGSFTAADFRASLAGQPLDALIDALESGNAYVNVHTSDGDATPNEGAGDFPGGEIRGNF